MVRITWPLIKLLFVVIRTATGSAEDESYVTEMEYSTITLMDTTFSTKDMEISSIRRNDKLSTHVATISTTDKPTNATATSKYLATSPTKKEQSSTLTLLTKQLSTSKVPTSEETSAHVTVTSTTINTPRSNLSTASTTHVSQFTSTTTSLPDSSSKSPLPNIVTATVGSSESRNTSAEVMSTPSLSYEDRSTTKGGFFSSPVIRSSSETYSSTITSPMHGGNLTSHAKSTKDADLTTGSSERHTTHAKSTSDSKSTTDSSEPNTNTLPLIAGGAGGAIVVMVGAGCLLFGVRKARKRQFWGSGANGSGVAEIGMIFTKTPSNENGLNSEDTIEVDTGLSCISENETEPKATIKVQGVLDCSEVDRTVTTFTPGPENYKRAQDRNLSDMIIVKYDEDDYFGDGDYRESVAL